jgi:signal transduction histidine kinase/ligand-binding sensor domain-containing protein/DNA-binding response OmpR family regulator
MKKDYFLSRKIILFILCAFLSLTLHAQTIVPKFDKLPPVLISNCVLQDSYGFIWIGDEGGLIKYDGYKFNRYINIPFDSTSLSNNWVMAIKEDKKGNLWVGTRGGGLNYFDQRAEKFTRFMHDKNNPNTISSNIIFRILVDNDGSLWLGTLDQGLIYMKIDSNGVTNYKKYNLDSDTKQNIRSGENFVLDIYKNKQGKLWIGTIEGGLKLLDPVTGGLTHFKNDPEDPTSISSNIVSSICEDDFGNLWIGTGHEMLTEGNGLNKLDPDTKQFIHYNHDPEDPSSLGSNKISSLLIDQDGTLWIGTLDNKLNSIPISELLSSRKPHFTHYSDFDGNNVNSIYEDRLGNIWISFSGMSVYKFNKQQNPFIWYRHIKDNPNGLSGTFVYMVQVDKSGNIWFGTDGLDQYDPVTGRFKHFPYDPDNPQALSSGQVVSMDEDKYGFHWIATENGLNRFNPKTGVFKHFFENPEDTFGLRSNVINSVSVRQSGDLWIASYKSGLQLYDLEENQFYYFDQDTNSVDDEGIRGIFEDQSGTLWSNTLDYGCFALRVRDYKIESVKHYIHDPNNRNSLSYNYVTDIIRPLIIDTNAVWMATGNGLNRLDLNTETFTHFYVEDGLPSNYILKVLEDNKGNIWCACVNDIAVYNIKTGKIKSYSGGDGMPITDFSSDNDNACKTTDGQLIFGGPSGSLGFYPEQLKENLIIPPIRLTAFEIFHEIAKLDTAIQFIKRIELTYDQNVFSFEFAALNFTSSEKNQYAYKLEGLYDEWIYIGNERVASFTNIEPGEYIFRVKGSNNHDIWNETGASVVIIITPPWWATTWAYIVYALIILSIIYCTWKLQIRRIRIKHDFEMSKFESEKMHEVDEMKSRFFANISHEFRTPLTLILGISKKILNKSKEQTYKDDIGVIKRNANRLHGMVNQLLDLSKLESGNMTLRTYRHNIIPLLKGLVLSFASFAEKKRITLKFNSDEEEIVVYLDKDKIEKIVTNLLSNAFKFTPQEGIIEFGVKKIAANVEITVSDTGIGISKERLDKIFDRFYQVDSGHTREQEGTGLGLAVTKDLVELHKGEIRVESSEGKGSTFTITLPLGKDHLKSEEIVEGKLEGEEVIPGEVELSPEYEEQKVRSDIELITEAEKLLLLIVEDNADVRDYIKGNLEEEFRILEAVDGEDGLNQAINYIPDLIISDVMMPKMDGFEMCDKIKNDERTSHIPIIMLTAKATSKDKIEGYETGADEYIMKPFDAQILRARINNLIQQRKRLREHFKKEGIFQINDADVTSTDKIFLKKALDIINKNISDDTFSVDSFAEEISMSKSQLRRKLVALVGESPGDLIRRIRLRKAAKLIEQNFGNISEIAAEVGFNNPANFAHSFKIYYGVSPSEYLNSKKA